MKNKLMISVLFVLLFLSASGCASKEEKQPEVPESPAVHTANLMTAQGNVTILSPLPIVPLNESEYLSVLSRQFDPLVWYAIEARNKAGQICYVLLIKVPKPEKIGELADYSPLNITLVRPDGAKAQAHNFKAWENSTDGQEYLSFDCDNISVIKLMTQDGRDQGKLHQISGPSTVPLEQYAYYKETCVELGVLI